MATSIGSIYLDLRASTEQLSKDAAKALGVARKLGNQAALAIAAGAATAATAVAAVWVKTAADIDKVAKSSNNLGVEFGKLRAIQNVGDLAGVAAEEIESSFRTMRKNITDAQMGLGKAQVAFEALNLSAAHLSALRPDEAFLRIGDALNQIPNSTVRAGLATKIFGDQATKMLEILRDGSSGIEAAAQKLHGLGIVMSRVDAAKVELANDALTDLKTIAQGAAEQLTVALAPILKAVADWMKQAAGETHGFKDAIKTMVDIAVQAAGYLGNIARGWQLVLKLGSWAFAELAAAVAKANVFVLETVGKMVQGAVGLLNVFLGHIQGKIVALAQSAQVLGIGLSTGVVPGAKAAGEAIADLSKKVAAFMSEADPKVTAENLTKALSAVTSIYRTSAESFSGAATDLWADLNELANQPLPKDALVEWVETARTTTQQAAEEIAQNVQAVYEAVEVPDIQADKMAKIVDTMQVRVFNPIQDALDSFQWSIGGLVRGTLTWKDALTEVAATFVTTVLQALVQMFAAWVAQKIAFELIGAQMLGTVTADTIGSAGAIQAAWVPAALAANIATMGAASGVGMSTFISSMALGSLAGIGIGAGASFVGGFLNTAAAGAGGISGSRASGGPVSAGKLYQVNESGREFFRPDMDGTVVPLGHLNSQLQTASTGPAIVITQHFESGITEAELAREAKNIERRTVAAVADAVSRGGGYRKMIQR